MMRHWRGFTLIELMMVVAVAALLVTLAAPSFYNFILVQRLKSITAQIETDLQFARSEAAARNLKVQVRFSGNSGTTCYALYTGREGFCDCTNPPSTPVCPAATETEIRTVQVPRSLGVQVGPGTASDQFGFDPATGGVSIVASDIPVPPGSPFVINSYIDSDRALKVVVKASGRPGICAPTTSTVTGVAAC